MLPCLLLALATPRQEPEPVEEPSIAEELAALIESTNALDSFHCVWLGEEEGVRLELAYEAPGKGRVTFTSPEEGEETRFDEERYYFRDEEDAWRSWELRHSEARQKLEELFPTGQRLGPGFQFFVGGSVRYTAFYQPGGRDALLAWLSVMQQESKDSVAREDDALVWTRPSGEEWRVARDTGFPRQITVKTSERTLELRLTECTTDEASVPLDPPEETEPAAEDDIQRMIVEMWNLPSMVRRDAFGRVGFQLASGARKWDARTRADWDELLVALHGTDIERPLFEWVKQLLAYINENLARVRATLEKQDTPEIRAKLAQYLDELEKGLAPGFEQASANYLARLEELEDVREELLEAEREAILRLQDERITQPVLEYLAVGREKLLGK